MQRRRSLLGYWIGVTIGIVLGSGAPLMAQQGIVLSGVGAVNRSMGGASVAAPIDASGAIHWNPASIVGLDHSEMDFGLELLYPEAKLSSSVAPGALGGGFPPGPAAGADRSDTGIQPLPTFGLVYRPEDPDWAFGLGAFAVGGFAANYPASNTNPILLPQALHLPQPFGTRPGGVGSIFSEFQIFQIAPTAAVRLTDHLSFGFAPTISLATLRADPAVLASPDDANGDGVPTFPSATHSRVEWGAGFQTGLYLTLDGGWQFGTSVKSPQWFEMFRYNSADEIGRLRSLKFDLDYPMIVSVGAGYTGFKQWVLAADVRYIDYRNTNGFRQFGFDSTGALRGFGWDSIMVVALGAQYQWTDNISLRMGYTYNENPIDNIQTSFNVASPTILEHTVYLGASYRVTQALALSVAYAHAFENSISGPIITPQGQVPGTSVESQVAGDTVIIGASVRFGCRKE